MYDANKNEQEILKYWDEHKCFEKSVSERPEKKPYVFYDGPPFATGLPHYGHIVASLMKDVVPRFWTMRGFRVERKWGWDCHGLPVENIIEKDLNLNSKKDIENFGIDKFNEACRATVLKYANEWKKTIKRMGRWVDMQNDYKTMDLSYMESVWWVFKQLWDRDLIYKGHKAMHICPRCVTPLSNFEVTQGYKDVKDLSVTAKFKIQETRNKQIINSKFKITNARPTYILAWTTTPWTLPGNVLLAVGEDIEYWILDIGEENYIVAKDRVEAVMKDRIYEIRDKVKGNDMIGLEYEPLFPYFADTKNGFRVVAGDFVSTTDGTGVVHIAPAFGEDDYNTGKRENVPMVQHVSMDGRFVPEVTDFAGQEVKPKEDPTKTDVEIIKYLAGKGTLFNKEKFEHSYPHCWRCDTPLLNYATSCWFVKVTELKKQLLKNNESINWVPEHIKEGRFGEWLSGARDWAISRNRFWGTPLPVWEDEKGEALCVGSVSELEELTGKKVSDLHKHKIDDLEIKKDGKTYRRIPEVLDCWFESGSMPYGQMHYPFENKKKFESGFPAEFIAEGPDQTRGWFYTLHVLAAALTTGKNPAIPTKKSVPAFTNCIVNGIVLAEDGKKMSKRLKNYPEPDLVLEKYGADAMRYYLVTSPVMEAESLNFSEVGVREVYNKLINTLWNVVEFYKMYSENSANGLRPTNSANVLDKWVLAKLGVLVGEVTKGMEEYKLVEASRPIVEFVTDLSQWYVRRSRDRFKIGDEKDKQSAIATLRDVLLTLSKIMAPFTPFIAEKMYLELGGKLESVHLESWMKVNKKIDTKILEQMTQARKVVEMGLALRAEAGIKVRQPLSKLTTSTTLQLTTELLQIIADELNVKVVGTGNEGQGNGVLVKEDSGLKVALHTVITDELKKEGLLREVVRAINQVRKEQKLTISDSVVIEYSTDDELLKSVFVDFLAEIKKSVLASDLRESDSGEEAEIDGRKARLKITKI